MHTVNYDIFVPQTSNINTRSSTFRPISVLLLIHVPILIHVPSFVPRTIRSWNLLPPSVTSTNSLVSFKLGLRAHLY